MWSNDYEGLLIWYSQWYCDIQDKERKRKKKNEREKRGKEL